jgi:hypothetical protein
MNTGNTRPFAHKRGLSTFMPMSEYPFQEREKRGDYYQVVELAVNKGIRNIAPYIESASVKRCSSCDGNADQVIRTISTLA